MVHLNTALPTSGMEPMYSCSSTRIMKEIFLSVQNQDKQLSSPRGFILAILLTLSSNMGNYVTLVKEALNIKSIHPPSLTLTSPHFPELLNPLVRQYQNKTDQSAFCQCSIYWLWIVWQKSQALGEIWLWYSPWASFSHPLWQHHHSCIESKITAIWCISCTNTHICKYLFFRRFVKSVGQIPARCTAAEWTVSTTEQLGILDVVWAFCYWRKSSLFTRKWWQPY